jgi:hypothetical protein
MITQKRLHELFNYEDGKLFWKVAKAYRVKIGDQAGWQKKSGYWELMIDERTYQVHRLIFLYHHGYLPKKVDHKDRNPSNNKIDNLRPITSSHNSVNSTKIRAKHGYKGVKIARGGNFEARIIKDGRYHHLGTFKTPEEAHEVYKTARQSLYPGVFTE